MSIEELLTPNSLQYEKGWKNKSLMQDYFDTLGIVAKGDDTQEDDTISQDDIEQEEVQEAPKKSRKKK